MLSLSKISGFPYRVVVCRYNSTSRKDVRNRLEKIRVDRNFVQVKKYKISDTQIQEQKRATRENVDKIRWAIQLIRDNNDYNTSYSSISDLTGLSYYLIKAAFKFSAEHDGDDSLDKLWSDMQSLKPFDNNSSVMIFRNNIKKDSAEQIKADLDKINSAIEFINDHPDYFASIYTLSFVCGLSSPLIKARLSHPLGADTLNKWNNLISYDKSGLRAKDDIASNNLYYDIKHRKNIKRAVQIINEAFYSGRKLSYKELEKTCNLTKDEIEELIDKMAQHRNNMLKLEKETKEAQKQWYAEHQDLQSFLEVFE